MSETSSHTKTLINRYQSWHQSLQKKPEASTIHVDEVASRVASFYEKIRGVVDWKEEHLFRKGAIERALKRRRFFQREGEKISAPLVYELIRGGHFPNDKIEESKIETVQKIIDKYNFILENSAALSKKKSASQFYDWILGIAACEIEETLAPPVKEKALIEYMAGIMGERIRVKEGVLVIKGVSEEEKNAQIYLAVQIALFNPDISLLHYNLLKRTVPQWPNPSEEEIKEITRNIHFLRENVEKDLNHPLADKFFQICEKYDTPFLILSDVIIENPMKASEILADPGKLEAKTREAYNLRAATLKSRLGRAAFYATLSIFLTNILSLYAIEIPLAKFVLGHFSPVAVAVDIFVPTLLMFLLIITIRPPKKENLEVAVMEVMKIAYEERTKDVYEIKKYPKRGIVTKFILTLFYLLSFATLTGLIVWALSKVNLPITSDIIFIIFISLIAFAGTKIRRRANELEIIDKRENIFYFFFDLFAIPVTQLGKWLSARWKKYNAIARFFSYLIDMPFQTVIEFLEQWRYFLKEKREEIH